MRKTLIDNLNIRQTQLAKDKEFLEKRLSTAPEGKLRISRYKTRYQYYIRTINSDTNGRFLKASEFSIAKKLAQKAYDIKELADIKKEKVLIDSLLSFINYKKPIYDSLSEPRKRIVEQFIFSDEDYVKAWLEKPFSKKEIQEGIQTHVTEKGDIVRSKSETMIANMLFHAGVPYKYEKPYKMENGDVYHPDFTILNKRTREIFILEHFGMMDDAGYRDSFFRKLHTYTMNGFIIGVNMFVSFEGNGYGHEFDGINIRNLIRECFT